MPNAVLPGAAAPHALHSNSKVWQHGWGMQVTAAGKQQGRPRPAARTWQPVKRRPPTCARCTISSTRRRALAISYRLEVSKTAACGSCTDRQNSRHSRHSRLNMNRSAACGGYVGRHTGSVVLKCSALAGSAGLAGSAYADLPAAQAENSCMAWPPDGGRWACAQAGMNASSRSSTSCHQQREPPMLPLLSQGGQRERNSSFGCIGARAGHSQRSTEAAGEGAAVPASGQQLFSPPAPRAGCPASALEAQLFVQLVSPGPA